MPWYELVKVVHFLGLIALFGSFVIYPRAGERLRTAANLADVRSWLGMLELTRGMFHGGVVMMLLSGAGMAAMRWRAPYPFVTVGLIALLFMWVVGSLTGLGHLRAIRAATPEGDGAVPAELSRIIRAARPWTMMFSVNLTALALLLIMTIKPGWAVSLAIAVAFAILGAVIGSTIVRRESSR